MFNEEYKLVCEASVTKLNFLKNNPIGYIVASVLAGAFIGFGTLLAFSAGGYLEGAAYTKIVMGLSFGVALSLVVMAGAELFTGNNMVMLAGAMTKKVKVSQMIYLWIICFFGNWLGALILAFVYSKAGLATGAVGDFMMDAAVAKASLAPLELFFRAVLCNMLVCLAVWCSFRCKNEVAKLIMIFWCLFAFVTTGFEHSIANMTLLSITLFVQTDGALTMIGYLYYIFMAAVGNIVGGTICVALPYFVVSRNKSEE